jgi:hypothetical protein
LFYSFGSEARQVVEIAFHPDGYLLDHSERTEGIRVNDRRPSRSARQQRHIIVRELEALVSGTGYDLCRRSAEKRGWEDRSSQHHSSPRCAASS